MKTAKILVALESDRYVVARAEGDGVTQVREIPRTSSGEAAANQTLAQTVAELDGNGRGVCLGLPGEMVLAAAIDLADLPRRRRRAAMPYRLEEHLPLDIEALTAVFLPPAGGQALALAVRTEQVRALLDGLRQTGIQVHAVCPIALLAFQEAARRNLPPADYVIIPGAHGTDILRLVDGLPVAWYTAPPQEGKWRRCLEADLLAHPRPTPRPTDRGLARGGSSRLRRGSPCSCWRRWRPSSSPRACNTAGWRATTSRSRGRCGGDSCPPAPCRRASPAA
jgi:hypothetical protein